MKAKETLETILGLVSAGAGLGAGVYLTRVVGNTPEDIMFKLGVISCSTGLALTAAKVIDDFLIVPYYKAKELNEKYGMKIYTRTEP